MEVEPPEPTALFTSAASILPHDTTLFNFQRVLGFINPQDPRLAETGLAKIAFFRALLNSVIFTALAVIPQIFFSATAAYAFARLRFPGRNLLFFLFIAATMIPAAVLFIPNFILILDLGWLNTFQGMAAPYALMTPFSVFFLRQMFLATPRDVEEAARIDGASYPSIFFRLILPIHRPALATLAILTTVSTWNDFFWEFLIGREESVRVIAVAINAFRTQQQAGFSGLDRSHGLLHSGNAPHDRASGLLRPKSGRVVPIQRYEITLQQDVKLCIDSEYSCLPPRC